MICTNALKTNAGGCCRIGKVHQPESKFIGQDGKPTGTCHACRDHAALYKRRVKFGEASRKQKSLIDPWLGVCERCPLDDCIRGEGELWPASTYSANHRVQRCPIVMAENREWQPEQALENADELGLLAPVEWLEW